MKTVTQLGIFMDHSHAHIMEYHSDSVECKSVTKHSIDHGDHHNAEKGELQIHSKQKVEQDHFYKNLGDVIINYDEVLLFGPTEAKLQLLHKLREDKHFSNVKIEVKNADKLTENQQHAFVKDHFNK